jgi:hypothetical protein
VIEPGVVDCAMALGCQVPMEETGAIASLQKGKSMYEDCLFYSMLWRLKYPASVLRLSALPKST